MADNARSMWIRNGSSANTTGIHHGTRIPIHMTFFWGHTAEVLFKGWPGNDTGMYALAIIFIFFLALLIEYVTYTEFVKPGSSKVAAGLFKTGLHTVRAGVNYMVILAVMSFNGGIFVAAVGGHAVGYLLFGSRIFKKPASESGSGKKSSDLPPL